MPKLVDELRNIRQIREQELAKFMDAERGKAFSFVDKMVEEIRAKLLSSLPDKCRRAAEQGHLKTTFSENFRIYDSRDYVKEYALNACKKMCKEVSDELLTHSGIKSSFALPGYQDGGFFACADLVLSGDRGGKPYDYFEIEFTLSGW